jgi:hypothetical protein
MTIVVRATSPEGKRSWVVANGKMNPPRVYYLRHCHGSSPKYIKVGNFYDEVEIGQMRLERRLKAHSLGFTVHEDNADIKKFHRITDIIAAYLSPKL